MNTNNIQHIIREIGIRVWKGIDINDLKNQWVAQIINKINSQLFFVLKQL